MQREYRQTGRLDAIDDVLLVTGFWNLLIWSFCLFIRRSDPVWKRRGHDELVTLLIESGASVTVTNQDGWTALHVAARTDDVAKARLLLQSEFSTLFTCGNNGRSIMHTVCLKVINIKTYKN